MIPPKWFGPVADAITYGQAPEEASECKDRWLEFFEDSVADGQPPAARMAQSVASFLGHVLWRTTHGERTALPAGILLGLAAISTFVLAGAPDTPAPPKVNVHVGLALLVVAFTFLRFPRWQPGMPLAIAGVLLATSMMHGLLEFSYVRIQDAVIVAGASVIIAGAVPVIGFAIRPERHDLRSWWLGMVAFGAAAFSLANLDLFHARQSLGSAAVSAAFVAATTAVVVGSLLGLRKQQPDVVD